MSWKKRLRMLFAKEAIVFKKKDTPNILQNFIEASIKETEQRVAKDILEKVSNISCYGDEDYLTVGYVEEYIEQKYLGEIE